jgi:hypothetical protein
MAWKRQDSETVNLDVPPHRSAPLFAAPPALRRRHRWPAATAAVLAVACVAGGAAAVSNRAERDNGHAEVATFGGGGASSQHRQIPIGSDTARLLTNKAHAWAQRHGGAATPVSAESPGDVLATTATIKGEMVLVGFAMPDGQRCVIQQYVRNVPGGGTGARCSEDGAIPYAASPIDLSAGEELNPGGQNVATVWGGVPAGSSSVVLRIPGRPDEVATAFSGGDEWGPRAFFIATWPIHAGGEVIALDEHDAELARTPMQF